jgi:hypothetical protein
MINHYIALNLWIIMCIYLHICTCINLSANIVFILIHFFYVLYIHIGLVQNRKSWRALENATMKFPGTIKCCEIIE